MKYEISRRKNPITPSVHKMAKHTLQILRYLLRYCQCEFDHFVDTKHYKVSVYIVQLWASNYNYLFLYELELSLIKRKYTGITFLSISPRPLHKKWSFPLRISSVNVTKSAVSCRLGHICWKNSSWKTSFFVQWALTHFISMLHFYISWKHLKNVNFFFLGGMGLRGGG